MELDLIYQCKKSWENDFQRIQKHEVILPQYYKNNSVMLILEGLNQVWISHGEAKV